MTAHEMVAKARNLPQVSEAALKLAQLVGQAESSHDEIVELLSCDAVLTAKLLKACNSPALGLREPVTSVSQAVLLLGHQEIHNLALTVGFGGSMAAPLAGYALKANALWHHVLTTATATEALAESWAEGQADASVAFTAGLLHDIGKLVMAQALTPEAQAAIRNHMAGEGLGSIEAEREVLGTDHAETGACLLYVWRLPEAVVEAVGNHHRPVLEPTPRFSALAHVANRIAHLAGDEPDGERYAFGNEERVAQVFGLDEKRREELLESVRRAGERVTGLMTVMSYE